MWIAILFLTVGTVQSAPPQKPCKALMGACKSAGYVRGGAQSEKKGLIRDCMKPLVEGTPVPGVKARAEDIAACRENHERREEKRRMKREQGAPPKPRLKK